MVLRLRPGLEDSISGNNSKKVVEFIDWKKLPSFHGPTIFHGWPYARDAWYKQFNSNEILPNNNLT